MKLIACVNENWGIGSNNDLLYHIKEDMKFFRSKTKDNVIIVGRKTLESFPDSKPLKFRTNIVLTKNSTFQCDDAIVVYSIPMLFQELKDINDKEVYLCGGAEIYSLLYQYCDEALITKVRDDKAFEKSMPNLDEDENWFLAEKSEDFKEDNLTFSFLRYINKSPKNYN